MEEIGLVTPTPAPRLAIHDANYSGASKKPILPDGHKCKVVFHKGTLLITYRKISNIRRTKWPNLNVSCLVLQLSLPNPMKPGVKSRMKM